MIGVIDVGNTFIHCCCAKNKKIISRKDFKDTDGLEEFYRDIREILIISNSEEKRGKIKYELKDKKIYNFPLERIKIDYNGRVGEDRISSAFYIMEEELYPAIIIDAGTAITLDYIDKYGIFSGGAILPGIKIFFESYGNVETLKFVEKELELRKYKGKNTKECISFGIYIYIKGIKDYIKETYKGNVIITGGDSNFFRERGWKIDKDLVLKGGIYAFYKFFT